jgi:formate hydrogenlyase subunit 3/multisubunit Na+/H+ antiporter MnhD subunit
MSLLAFLSICAFGAVAGLADESSERPDGRAGTVVGLVCLLAAMVAALFVGSTTRLSIADITLAGSEYSGRFLACFAGSALALGLVATASGRPGRLAPAALVSFAGLAVAVTAVDAGVALAAGAAAIAAGALVLSGEGSDTPPDGRLDEIRTIGITTFVLLGASIVIAHPAWTGGTNSPALVLGFCALGLGLAIRGGAVPFHVPASRLGASGSRLAPALLFVWIPAGLGIVAISWSASTFGIRSEWLDTAVAAMQAVALATIVLGATAALVHDELGEIVAYSIVADAGFVLLALAARSDAAAEPARMWLLAFVAAKTGLVAWAAAMAHVYGTANLGRLRGWLRRTPLLGLALAATLVATLGWPGSAVYEARSALFQLGVPGGLQFLLAAAIILSLAYTGRVLLVGLLSPTEDVADARSEMPHLPVRPTATPQREVAAEAVAAEAVAAEAVAADATVVAVAATTDAAPPSPGAAEETTVRAATSGEPGTKQGLLRRAAAVGQLNRTLETSFVVAAGAAVAVLLAFGGLGGSDASQFGIPLDTAARATPTPTPVPTLATTPTPLPTLAPHITALPTSSPGPSGSTKPSTSPAVKTKEPIHGPGQ